MRGLLIMALTAAAGVLLGYLAGAFGSAGFDISQWGEIARIFTLLAMLVFGVAGAGFGAAIAVQMDRAEGGDQ